MFSHSQSKWQSMEQGPSTDQKVNNNKNRRVFIEKLDLDKVIEDYPNDADKGSKSLPLEGEAVESEGDDEGSVEEDEMVEGVEELRPPSTKRNDDSLFKFEKILLSFREQADSAMPRKRKFNPEKYSVRYSSKVDK